MQLISILLFFFTPPAEQRAPVRGYEKSRLTSTVPERSLELGDCLRFLYTWQKRKIEYFRRINKQTNRIDDERYFLSLSNVPK